MLEGSHLLPKPASFRAMYLGLTHAQLVTLAGRWLRSKRCHLVLEEIGTEREAPDAIGWTNGGHSILVECKTSVEDFRKDAKKFFRRMPEYGMGAHRWFLIEEGGCVIPFEGLPPRWGLLTVGERRKGQFRFQVVRQAQPFERKNERAEKVLLVSACRRVTEGWGRKVFGEVAPPLVDGDPHPTTAKVIKELREALSRASRREQTLIGRVARMATITEPKRVCRDPMCPGCDRLGH